MVSKEILIKIEQKLREGTDKEDIFRELGGGDDLATALASTPYFSQRNAYKIHNLILVAIISFYAISKFTLSVLSFKSSNLPIYIYPLTLFVPVVALLLAREIKKFRGGLYLVISMLSFALIVRTLGESFGTHTSSYWLIWAVIHLPVAIGGFLAYYLKRKLCPNLKFLGARSENGVYKF